MAKVSYDGTLALQAVLDDLQQNAEPIIKEGIYESAKIMADEVKRQIRQLRTDGPSEYETRRREVQKQGLIDSMGISSMRNENGFLNVKIGFDGYNELGQANAMIARIFNSGTSFSTKQPFVKRATSNAKKLTVETMKSTIDERIFSITEGEGK